MYLKDFSTRGGKWILGLSMGKVSALTLDNEIVILYLYKWTNFYEDLNIKLGLGVIQDK